MYLSLLRSLFLHTPLSYHLCPFISLHRTLMIISCREGLVVRNSLNICFSGNVLIFLSLMNNSLPDIVFLLESFFFLLALWINQLTVFWPPKFLMRNLLVILLKIPCMWRHFSLAAFKIISFFVFQIVWLYCASVWVSLSSSFLQFTELLGYLYLCL